MSRVPRLFTGALAGLLGAGAVQAATLDISIAAQGASYNNLVADAKLRGDGGFGDWNLGASSGDSNRIYANYLLDGITQGSRQNTFVQRFDVSSIPPGSTIKSATLTQYFANQNANERIFTAMKLSQMRPGKGWIETTQSPPGTTGPHFDGSVTWNSQASITTLWGAPGATGETDIFLDTTKTFDLIGVDGTATTITLDITSWVQDWVNHPANNTGMLWWGGNSADSASANRYFRFGVKEDGAGPASDSAAAAPTLVIEYTTGPAAPVLTNVTRSGNTFSASFSSEAGVNYKLQYNDTLADGAWNDGTTIAGDGSVKTLSDTSTRAIRFYRVVAF
jgi:hypothetical protein